MSQLKIVNASQGQIHDYENLKRKLYSCNASIYFNKQCLQKRLTPTYAKVKIPSNSLAANLHSTKYNTSELKTN
jgi:hypothetical protein